MKLGIRRGFEYFLISQQCIGLLEQEEYLNTFMDLSFYQKLFVSDNFKKYKIKHTPRMNILVILKYIFYILKQLRYSSSKYVLFYKFLQLHAILHNGYRKVYINLVLVIDIVIHWNILFVLWKVLLSILLSFQSTLFERQTILFIEWC